MSGIKIVSTGRYIPDKEITNEDLSRIVETNDEWIATRTGIRRRHISQGEPNFFMATHAAKEVLKDFSGEAEDIDLILCSTLSPDYYTPSLSCLVAGAIGATSAFCIDVNCACTGFVQAVDMAHKYLAAGDVKTVLVIASEVLSRIVDFTDRATCVLFGDGAGACIVQKDDTKRFASTFGADGKGGNFLYATHTYPRTPFETDERCERHRTPDMEDNGFIHMDGKEVYKFSTSVMPRMVEACCKKLSITPQDLRMIVPHQANERIVATGMKHLKLPMEKAYLNIEQFGNTSSATIPIALDEVIRKKLLQPGDLVALVGFGAGLTYGATVIEW